MIRTNKTKRLNASNLNKKFTEEKMTSKSVKRTNKQNEVNKRC